jgi:hypothetical protein
MKTKTSNIFIPMLLSLGIALASVSSEAAPLIKYVTNNQQEDAANVVTVLQTDLKFSTPKGFCPVDKNSPT